MENHTNRKPVLIYVLAALVAVWGILGLMDSKNYTWAGYDTDGNNTVIRVQEGSPAEAAGLQVGDYMFSIDGISMNDSKAWEKKARPEIGETRTFLIERDKEEVELGLTYAALEGKNKTLNYVGFALGLIFLLCGLWIFASTRSKAGFIFTLVGIFFASAFFNGPYFQAPAMRGFFGYLDFTFLMAAFAMLAYFMLQFPSPRQILEKKSAAFWIAGPAVLLAIVVLVLEIMDPDASSTIRTTMRILVALVVLYYFGWALLTMFRQYGAHSAEARGAKGLNLLLVGAVLGLLPILLVVVIGAIAPKLVIPGEDYAFIFLGLIPILFALAIRKSEAASA